jgi:hypothetical protein
MSGIVGHHDWKRVTRAYRGSRPYGFAVIDDFLVPAAAAAVHRRLLADGAWTRPPGSPHQLHSDARSAAPELAEIAAAVRERCSAILGRCRPLATWAVLHTDNQPGVAHWDRGCAVLNVWLTPDRYNLNAGGGGLVLFDVHRGRAELPYSMLRRRWPDPETGRSPTNAVAIPYRHNRAVLMDAGTLHQTDALSFANGSMEARRMNLAIAFGPDPG